MSRFVLFCFILSLILLKNEVKCGTLGKISKSDESLLPRADGELPNNWARLNLAFPSGNKVSVNTTSRIDRAGNTTLKRQAKFLPRFSFVTGVDVGGGLTSRAVSNLTPLAKISQASTLPAIISPYFSASFDPYPSSSALQQFILTLYRLVDRLSQTDNSDKLSNNSAVPANALFTSENINMDMVDDRKRRKDKIKIKKSIPKRKKQEKLEVDEEEETYDDEEKGTQNVEIFNKVKSDAKSESKTNSSAKQAMATDTSGIEKNATNSAVNSTSKNTTMDQGNTTYPQNPEYYYGGNPQPIGNIGFTYDRPQESYGPPSDNYGPPSNSYGPPSYSYGPPSQNYGSPSYSYGPSSQSYETAHYTSVHDHEPVIYEDPNESSFGPSPSERWRQRLPFARSRNLGKTTHVPSIINSNGFTPIL